MRFFRVILILLALAIQINLCAQKVGLVLSGGGATAIAHLGVIMALEEEGIPIDYITGTSMGALIGGLYASGYSPAQISDILNSERVKNMTAGVVEHDHKYFFKELDPNASLVTIKLHLDSIAFQSTLPTNVISPYNLDFQMMKMFAGASAASNYDFDSLFVPFRCLASDIESKTSVKFEKGNLSQAIRASMAYPFYLKPIKINGKLLFDGGLYNNFPIDVMYDEFIPDIIIGSNVTQNVPPPDEDDVVSQIKTMLLSKTNYTSDYPAETFVITPPSVTRTFSFKNAYKTVESGYNETKKHIEEIKKLIQRKVNKQDLDRARSAFNSKIKPLQFDDIEITGVKKGQANYVRKLLKPSKRNTPDIDNIKNGYFRIISDHKIKSVYPLTKFDKTTGKYDLTLNIKKERDIIAEFGGNFSDNPINQAYIGLQYNYLGNTGLTLIGNSYFGKLYGSVLGKVRWDIPIRLPLFLEASFVRNRYDYFKSRATFFEDINASFFVQYEQYEDVKIGFPITNKGRLKLGGTMFQLQDEYYQTSTFQLTDTTDNTYFDGTTAYMNFEYNTLNDKQYANSGAYFGLIARVIDGAEFTIPGSTSNDSISRLKLHQWFTFKLLYNKYYRAKGTVRLGVHAELVYSTQPLFNNYSANVLRAPAFQPTPQSKTLFLESFRAFKFLGLGHKTIFHLRRNLDIRAEVYLFQPFEEIIQGDEDLPVYLGDKLRKRFTIATLAMVYKTPVGPLSLSFNYYHNNPEVAREDTTPLTFLFHFGYVIFNKRAIND